MFGTYCEKNIYFQFLKNVILGEGKEVGREKEVEIFIKKKKK